MRVLIIHNTYQQKGGEDNVVGQEEKLLKDHGFSVEVFIISNDSIQSTFSKVFTALNVIYSKKSKQLVSEKIKSFRPDVVHVHNFFPLLTPSVFYACKESDVAVVHTLHNYRLICPSATLLHQGQIYEKSIKHSPFSAVLKKVYRNSMLGTFFLALMIEFHKKIGTWDKKVDFFISLTSFAKHKFIEAGFSSPKILIKPNFTEDPYLEKSKLQERENFALFVGRLSDEKGIEVILKAWSHIDYQLKIIGDGPLYKKLKEEYDCDRVHFLGNQPKQIVDDYMGKAKFLVMPSIWYEGFPMVIVEALAHGLPIVASKLGAMEEIIQDKITGVHFSPGNHKELSIKINTLIQQEDLLRTMGINARKVFLNSYSPEKNFSALKNIYEQAYESAK